MTEAQAKQLGKLITRSREGRDWSLRHLAREIGADVAWLHKLERGGYTAPAPDRLVRIIEALDIDPERIDRITRGHLSRNLPGMRTYFRATAADLSDGDIARIEKLVNKLRREHGGDDG